MQSPWLYLAVSGWLFSALIFHWLGLSTFREMEFDRFHQSLVVFSPSIFGAATAFVFRPDLSADGNIAMETHYFFVAPWVFPLAAAFSVAAGLSDLLVAAGEPAVVVFLVVQAALLFSLSFTRRRASHYVVLGCRRGPV